MANKGLRHFTCKSSNCKSCQKDKKVENFKISNHEILSISKVSNKVTVTVKYTIELKEEAIQS